MPSKVIFFDLGGVVCRFRPERRLAALGEACGVSADQVESVLYASGLIERWDRGLGSSAEIHRAVREGLGYRGDRTTLHQIWCRAFEPDPQVLELVEGLRPLRTALLTDNDPLLLDALPDVLPHVASRFDALLFSCQLGATKPDPDVFNRALDLMGSAPSEAVFIDDKAANVAAAQELGITAIRFSGPAELGAALDRLLAP
ncbi:HAD family phosphatase [Micromonospora sp. NPDC023888]|uniref:HAD family hydrolase n=1 Tax=Micromonospora sp. NPDC023888 TaxID=3155607 RepID=UPI0034046B2D